MAFPLLPGPCVRSRGHSRRALSVSLPLLLLAALALFYPGAAAAAASKKKILSFGMTRSGSDSTAIAHPNHQRRVLHHVPTFKDFSKMKYQNDGVFYTHISLGGAAKEQQPFSAILDTGSSTIAVPCGGCTKCGDHHAQFDIHKSSTAKEQRTRYVQCYAEGSCNVGQNVVDNICFGSDCPVAESAPISFGCCNQYSPMFQAQTADGIIGVGPGSNLVKHLHDLHKLDSYEFAICLDNNDGRFSVGGYSEALHTGPMQWTTLGVSPEGHYQNFVGSIGATGGPKVTLPEDERETLFDSGTTYTYVTQHIFQEFQEIFRGACKGNGKCDGNEDKAASGAQKLLACYDRLTPAQKKTFPTLELTFAKGMVHKVTPDMYFFNTAGKTCIGIFDDPQDTFTLGANFMRGHDIVYNLGEKKMGVAKSTCQKLPAHNAEDGGTIQQQQASSDETLGVAKGLVSTGSAPWLLVGVAAAALLAAVGAAVLRKRRMDAVEDQFLRYAELPGSAVATKAGPGNGEYEYMPPDMP